MKMNNTPRTANYSTEWDKIRNLFWDGKDLNGKSLSIDEEGIDFALKRALKDYTARTEKKTENESIASAEAMAAALESYKESIAKYFSEKPKANEKDFDKWHNEMCEEFIKSIKAARIRTIVPYGKAQKVLNMTFKNLYCFEDAEKKQEHFKYCHMALDSFILDWFRKRVAEDWFNTGRKQKDKIKISQEGGPLPKWSSLAFKKGSIDLEFKDYSDISKRIEQEKYHYMFIVTCIREYIGKSDIYSGLTPFQAEFYIWIESQYEQAAANLLKQELLRSIQNSSQIVVKNPTIAELNNKIINLAKELSKYYN